jgi:hypothetical protein
MAVASMTRVRRFVAVGAFAAAAVAAPIAAAALSAGAPSDSVAAPQCLAWFGSKADGKCLSYANNGFQIGTPVFNGGNGPDAGWSSGPLLPGTSINQGIG